MASTVSNSQANPTHLTEGTAPVRAPADLSTKSEDDPGTRKGRGRPARLETSSRWSYWITQLEPVLRQGVVAAASKRPSSCSMVRPEPS